MRAASGARAGGTTPAVFLSDAQAPAVTPVTIPQVARHFGVDLSTVRRWIVNGCPVVRRGRRGPGGGAVLDLDAVIVYRGGPVAGRVGFSVDEVMEDVAAALRDAVMRDNLDLRVDITKAQAATACVMLFEQIGKQFGRLVRWDEAPEAIRALMPLL